MEEVNIKAVYCRICGIKAKKLVKIYSRRGQGMGLEDKILKCLMLSVNRSDQLPTRICFPCIDRLDDFSQFLLHVKQAQVKLRTLLKSQGIHVKDEKNELLSTWKALLAHQERESANLERGRKRKRRHQEKIYDSSESQSSDSTTADLFSSDAEHDGTAENWPPKMVTEITSENEHSKKETSSKEVVSMFPKKFPKRHLKSLKGSMDSKAVDSTKDRSDMLSTSSVVSNEISPKTPQMQEDEISTSHDSVMEAQGLSNPALQPESSMGSINVTVSPPIVFPPQVSNSVLFVPGTNSKSLNGGMVPFYIWNVPKPLSSNDVGKPSLPHVQQIEKKKHTSKAATSVEHKNMNKNSKSCSLSKPFLIPKVPSSRDSPDGRIVIMDSNQSDSYGSKPNFLTQLSMMHSGGMSNNQSNKGYSIQGSISHTSKRFGAPCKKNLVFVNTAPSPPNHENLPSSQKQHLCSQPSSLSCIESCVHPAITSGGDAMETVATDVQIRNELPNLSKHHQENKRKEIGDVITPSNAQATREDLTTTQTSSLVQGTADVSSNAICNFNSNYGNSVWSLPPSLNSRATSKGYAVEKRIVFEKMSCVESCSKTLFNPLASSVPGSILVKSSLSFVNSKPVTSPELKSETENRNLADCIIENTCDNDVAVSNGDTPLSMPLKKATPQNLITNALCDSGSTSGKRSIVFSTVASNTTENSSPLGTSLLAENHQRNPARTSSSDAPTPEVSGSNASWSDVAADCADGNSPSNCTPQEMDISDSPDVMTDIPPLIPISGAIPKQFCNTADQDSDENFKRATFSRSPQENENDVLSLSAENTVELDFFANASTSDVGKISGNANMNHFDQHQTQSSGEQSSEKDKSDIKATTSLPKNDSSQVAGEQSSEKDKSDIKASTSLPKNDSSQEAGEQSSEKDKSDIKASTSLPKNDSSQEAGEQSSEKDKSDIKASTSLPKNDSSQEAGEQSSGKGGSDITKASTSLPKNDSSQDNHLQSKKSVEWLSEAVIESNLSYNPVYSIVKCCSCSSEIYPFLITLASASDHHKFIHSEGDGSFGCIKCNFASDQKKHLTEQLESLRQHLASGCTTSNDDTPNAATEVDLSQNGTEEGGGEPAMKAEPKDDYERAFLNLKNALRKVTMPRFRKLISSCDNQLADSSASVKVSPKKSSLAPTEERESVLSSVHEKTSLSLKASKRRDASSTKLFIRQGNASYICRLCGKKCSSKHKIKVHIGRHKAGERERFINAEIYNHETDNFPMCLATGNSIPEKMLFDIPPIKVEQLDSPPVTNPNDSMGIGYGSMCSPMASAGNKDGGHQVNEPGHAADIFEGNDSVSEGQTRKVTEVANSPQTMDLDVEIPIVKGELLVKFSSPDNVSHSASSSVSCSFTQNSGDGPEPSYVNHSRYFRSRPIVKPLFKSPINKDSKLLSQSSGSHDAVMPKVEKTTPSKPTSELKRYSDVGKKLSLKFLSSPDNVSTQAGCHGQSNEPAVMDPSASPPTTPKLPCHLRGTSNMIRVIRPKPTGESPYSSSVPVSTPPNHKSPLVQQAKKCRNSQHNRLAPTSGLVLKVPFIKLQRLNLLNVDTHMSVKMKSVGVNESEGKSTKTAVTSKSDPVSKSKSQENCQNSTDPSQPVEPKDEPSEKLDQNEESIFGW